MTFNSFQYALFFLVVWLVVALLLRPSTIRRFAPKVSRLSVVEARNVFLLLASYVFYGAWDVRFLGLLMLSTSADYTLARAISSAKTPQVRKRYITLSVAGNLGLLAIFKYFGFFTSSFAALCSAVGIQVQPITLQVVLPVGISFYTFQSLSYTIDVYRRSLPAERSLLRFAVFVAFFPQLVAGPIERPERLLPQFKHLRRVTWDKVSSGSYLIAVGLFKKVVIADTLSKIVNAAFDLKQPTGLQVLVGAYLFAFQIYADFSAYSDIARGSARCIGFELSRNFNLPYFAATPSDFWRRWHISLSTWLRDYLYVSLGGNRGGKLRTYRNLMLTMIIGGLWHGAAWTYVIWGTFHGVVLCAYRALERPVQAWAARRHSALRWLLHGLAIVLFFHLICVSWVFFRAASLAQATSMLAALYRVPTPDVAAALAELGQVGAAFVLISALVLIQAAQELRRDQWLVFHAPVPVRGFVYAVATVIFTWMGEDGESAFIYFQF